jgi:hypothetical protein
MSGSTDRPVLRPTDLSALERTYLGVLDTGMVSARLAGDPTLSVDYVVAVCLALREGKSPGSYLAGEAETAGAFRLQLAEAARALDEKGVIALAPPPPDLLLAPGGPPPVAAQEVDFEQRPKIWDRYLAHACLEELFADGRVYPFLMGKYQDSGELWARLYTERPERFL